MELSELTKLIPKRRRSAIEVSCGPNYKLYYNTFPHAIRIKTSSVDVFDQQIGHKAQVTRFKNALKENLAEDEYRIRNEWFVYSIFCKDIEKTLTAICKEIGPSVLEIKIEQMSETVLETASVNPKLPRAVTVVVKQLPYETYRYKVYWPTTSGKMKAIGQHSLEAITAQINSFPGCRPIKKKLVDQIHKMGYQWNGRYFYTNTEDIFSIISLIDQRFITRIEKFVTLEEVNEKESSRSTN